jgi:tRNA(Arg) A34 adenosine deaminase TadA
MDDTDRKYLARCVELAQQAFAADNDPFGSVLVSALGEILFEDHNHTAGGDETRHPEFEIARWAAAHMTPAERAAATVYTSGEHCPMCAAAHGWVGLGRIVYAGSSAQLAQWLGEIGAPLPAVNALPIAAILRDPVVEGPEPSFASRLRSLHQRRAAVKKARAGVR